MPRRKKVSVEKTPLEVALEGSPSAVDDAATVMAESAAKGRRKRTVKPKAKEQGKRESVFEMRKIKFRKKRVSYNEGDLVEIVEAGESFSGTLINILASQLVVRREDGTERFFFQSGINIKKLEG